MIHDDYLVLCELHHRWKQLKNDPKTKKDISNDPTFWQLVDNLNAKEFEALKDRAFRSPMLRNRSDLRIWAENKIATKPFQVRPPEIRWKNNYENKYLWTLLMNAMEQIEQDL